MNNEGSYIGDTSDIDLFGTIVVGNNVQIGSRAIIMPRVSIGDNVIIGAGAIVTKDVPSNSVMVGVPARKIETIQDYYKKNKGRLTKTKKMTSAEKKEFLLNYFGSRQL